MKSATALFCTDSVRYVLNPFPTTMLQPSLRRSIGFNTFRPVLRPLMLGCSLGLASACASMFKITAEDGTAPATKPTAAIPAEMPVPKVEKPKAKQPPKIESPKVEKPPKVETPKVVKPKAVEKKPETKVAPKASDRVVEKKPEPAPNPVKESAPAQADKSAKPVAIAPPPEIRRAEPVVEPPALEPTPAGSDSAGIDRLAHAAVLWDAVRLFHPTVAADRAGWDNETVRRLTDVRNAITREQFGQTVNEWLSRLNDPVTRIISDDGIDRATSFAPAGEVVAQTQVVVTGSKKTRTVDTTIVITWPQAVQSTNTAAWNSLYTSLQNLGTASQVVIDLRTSAPSFSSSTDGIALRAKQLEVASALATMTVVGPSIRRRVYEGWPDERDGISASATTTVWRVSEPLVVVRGESPVQSRRLVFVANQHTELPAALMALVSSKQATLVTDAPLSDGLLVPTRQVTIGQRFSAVIRVGELLNADGSVGIQPDMMVAASTSADSAPVIRTAIQVARGKLTPRARVAAINARVTGATIASNAWTNAHYPILGARLLSVFKMWGTLRAFHAYNDLRDENVDDALARFIPRVEAAADAYSYSSVMLEYATTMNDAQAEMTSPTIVQHLGSAAAPFVTRWIEGRAIVTQVAADDAGRATGLSVGDEITAADGYPMAAYVSEHRKYGPASNEWTGYRNTTGLIPRGVPGGGLFKVRDANNRERTATIPRDVSYLNRLTESERASTNVFREFAGRVGYIDMDRANAAHVDSAFQTLGASRALILDARGRTSPNASTTMTPAMRAVLRRVAALPNAVLDRQTIRVASEPCAPADSRLPSASCIVERRQFDDMISTDTASRFKGRVVVLIDERTQGAMEQFALGIEGAANPVFIGSPSAGAAGALTSMKLPGFITLTFSGSELRHADGRQLQRVGLTPQVEVAPTVKGVRAGTDEILARAQAWLLQQLDPATPKRKP